MKIAIAIVMQFKLNELQDNQYYLLRYIRKNYSLMLRKL